MNIQKIMTTILLLTAAEVASAGTISKPAILETGKTRIEVIAELQQAYDQGLLPQNDADFSGDHRFSIQKTASDSKVQRPVKTY